MQHDYSLLLDPAHDEDEVEDDDVAGEDGQTVELGQVGELPDHVGWHAEDVVEQGVALEEVANKSIPR